MNIEFVQLHVCWYFSYLVFLDFFEMGELFLRELIFWIGYYDGLIRYT